MTHERQVYLLDPQKLPPETIAVTFAKTSRSPESFRQIAADLTDQKSSEFNEKWVVGYGHSSVAEHAVLHIAVENASRLAVECIESNRLASFTEKSTRYQTWSPDAYILPDEWKQSPLLAKYQDISQKCFDDYARFIPVVQPAAEAEYPKQDGESDATYKHRIRSLTIDVCRYLLPASSLANVGITINARALEHAIGKMLSHPLNEVRQIGKEIKAAAREVTPTLLKYADSIPYLSEIDSKFAALKSNPQAATEPWFRLLAWDKDAVDHLLAAVYYRFAQEAAMSYPQARQTIESMEPQVKADLLRVLLIERGRHTIPLRELEHITFEFEATLDQGAYYEVKRHRMMTLTPRPLTAKLGYALPRLIATAGLEDEYHRVMQTAKKVYEHLSEENPDAAAYVVPNAFNRRFLISINLRSAMHFISLRSAPNAHFAIRRMATKLAEEIERVIPELHGLLPVCTDESAESIERTFFGQIA